MSGIAGVVHAADTPVNAAVLSKMAECLALRGPDGGGTWVDGAAGLAYSLLGAPSRPEQALVVRGHLAIVADARIDAKDELFEQFDSGDRTALRRATDAELVLYCYQRWGCQCLEHFIGDFSFAIWDQRNRCIFCARDPFGVKPLFYSATSAWLVFSNTLDCLRVHPDIGNDLDRQAIADFLLFGQYQEPAATAFSSLRRLPAGHSLRWSSGSAEIRRYWTLPFRETMRAERDADYIAGFRHVLGRAVSDRIHPVRTSILMSGGLDSTMVAAVAAGQTSGLKSFAIVYDRLLPDPERHYAQAAADALRIPLQCLAADNYKLFERLPGIHQATPEPVDEPVPGPFSDHLSQVKSFSHVALSGVGGDQLLFPSPNLAVKLVKSGQLGRLAGSMYKYFRLRQRIPPVGFRGAALRKLGLSKQPKSTFPPWLNPDLVKELRLHERWDRAQRADDSIPPTDRPEAYRLFVDPAWQWIFESYDAGVTKTPVDVRHPLFDVRLVHYCLGLPPIPWCVDKTLARAAMLNQLPDCVRLRPKSRGADPVAIRLPSSPWVDVWTPVPQLAQFVDLLRIPPLAATGTSWDPHHRPLMLNQWLSQLTVKGG